METYTQEISAEDMRKGRIYMIDAGTRKDIVEVTDMQTVNGDRKLTWEVRSSTGRIPPGGFSAYRIRLGEAPEWRVYVRPSEPKVSSPTGSSYLLKATFGTMIVGVASLIGIAAYRVRSGV